MTDVKVPVVDLSSPDEAAAQAVRVACVKYGFLYVCNHGVVDELLTGMFEESKKFFDLPLEEKMKIVQDENNRGYTPLYEETLDPEKQKKGDSKEGLYFGREVAPDSEEARKPLHGPNQWPNQEVLPKFQSVATGYFDAMRTLGMKVIRLLALALDLPADYFEDKFSQPMLFLRPLHYVAEKSEPDEGIFGAGAHTDYGMITLLATDGVPGLQIYLDGTWIDVPPVPGTLVVNLGNMLERWTNGLFRSTMHRVINAAGIERYSIPFFMEPNFDAMVECLPSCASETNPPKFPPVTSGEHLLSKYAATHSGYHVAEAK